MLSVDVYGSLIFTPDPILETLIDGFGLPRSEQYWRRKELPDFFDKIQLDKSENPVLNSNQKAYATREFERCKNGYWFYNNGEPTFITGKNYFYLQWWFLEDSIYPDYRDTDRRYFLFLDYWEKILWCLGIARGKKRREGASSQATSNIIYECIFFSDSNCGLVSKTETDSKNTFTDMVRHGYNSLPIFMKPRLFNKATSVTELIFSAGVSEGLKSKVTFRAPVLNAYDSGRLNRGLWDEGGKWPIDKPFSKFISIVSKTMVKGAKRVGFAECPSTVNEMTKGGGKEYKKFWDNANQFKYPGRPTPNRFVTYFTAAYDGYEGFIDKHGMSVIGEPTHEQYQYLVDKWVRKDPHTRETITELTEEIIKQGAKKYVIVTRRKDLQGDDLEEEIRMNPCSVNEMFESADTDCAFNSSNIRKRQKELDEAPIYKRKVIFYRNEDQTVTFRDVQDSDGKFYWKFTSLPDVDNANKYKIENKLKTPTNIADGAIAVDSYSNTQGGRKYGSKASAMVGRKYDPMNPSNTGRVTGHLYGRPKEKDDLHKQVMLAAEYHGYKVWYEHTADDYLTYFRNRGKINYLGTYPLSMIDPTKRKDADRFKGTPLTPFSLTKQLDNGIAYFEHHCDMMDFEEILENALIFDPYNRTAFDCLVCFLILISVLQEPVSTPQKPPEPLVRTFVNDMATRN